MYKKMGGGGAKIKEKKILFKLGFSRIYAIWKANAGTKKNKTYYISSKRLHNIIILLNAREWLTPYTTRV